MSNHETLLDRFLKYVKIDTQAVHDMPQMPSSKGQLELAKIVIEDLKQAGVQDIKLTDDGYLLGTIPSNIPEDNPAYGKVPVVGFLSHFDTAAECSGNNVKPQVIKNYNGKTITYPDNSEIFLTTEDDLHLKDCIGHTIITASGKTLLGADDKAGIAAIVEMSHRFCDHPEKLHGKIRIVIIPDEEIAVGAAKLNLKEFGADVAYTVDGEWLGEIDVESFNGFKGKVSVQGVAAFPGYGKGVYLNATKVLSNFVSLMSEKHWPENCEARQSIWWVDGFKGEVDKAEMTIFLRSFDLEDIEEHKKLLNNIKETLLQKYAKAKIDIAIESSYKNYKYELDKDKRIVEYAEDAVKRAGVNPHQSSIRGGNDSCHLCFAGLLSTNVFAGFRKMHSLKEWTSFQVIEKSAEVITELACVWAEKTMCGKRCAHIVHS